MNGQPTEGTIDLHTHVVPRSLPIIARLADRDPRWATVRVDPSGAAADVIVSGRLFRRVRDVAFDFDARRRDAHATTRAGQLLSAMPELFAAWAPATDAQQYCSEFNDWLATEIGQHEGFFHGLGIVPIQDPDRAAAALAGIADRGLLGVEVPSQPPGRNLHDPAYGAFFDEAQRLGLLVFLHSVGDVSDYPHPMTGTSAVFPARIGEAVAGLIAAGVLATRPELRLLASHGGGGLPASLARLDFVRDMTPAVREYLPEPARAYARRIWFDTLLFDPALIALLAQIVGVDRVVFGTDYPFLTGDVESVLSDPALPHGFAEATQRSNPRRLLDELTRPRQTTGGTS